MFLFTAKDRIATVFKLFAILRPEEYRMTLHLTFESGDGRYSWLNGAVVIASSARNGKIVIYDAYQVL